MNDLRVEGYVNVPGVVPKTTYVPLRECVARLHERRIPLPFAFVYDEMWQAFQGLSAFIGAALGPRLSRAPRFLGVARRRRTTRSTAGPRIAIAPSPPSSATTHRTRSRSGSRSPKRRRSTAASTCFRPISIRASRAASGTATTTSSSTSRRTCARCRRRLAACSPGIRASCIGEGERAGSRRVRARAPRSSFSAATRSRSTRPLLDPASAPPFSQRLGLIGKQVLQYKHMYPLTPDVAAIAETLRAALHARRGAHDVKPSRRGSFVDQRAPILAAGFALAAAGLVAAGLVASFAAAFGLSLLSSVPLMRSSM